MNDQKIRQKDKPDRERAETISRAVQDCVEKNPGMSHATAWNLLRQKRPELFTDEQGRGPIERDTLTHANQKKQKAIRDEIKKMQDADPDLPFTVAWR